MIRAGLAERRPFKVACGAPRNWKNNQEISVYHQSSTYESSGVALEGTGVDLDVCTLRKNCSALLSWMFRPGNWSTKKVQERSADQHSFTYGVRSVGVESTGVDLDVCIIRINCATDLKVGCAAPGHREISGTF
jgi:hypothetical protein